MGNIARAATRRRIVRALEVLLTVATLAGALVIAPGAGADSPGKGSPVTGAAFTTINESHDGGYFCQNGNAAVNCNIYDAKPYVWLSGGPATAYVGPGEYFFSVLEPGGQVNPNDMSYAGDTNDKLLSEDTKADRTYTVGADGAIAYSGTHTLDGNKLNLMPYTDTTNSGGVYILAICSTEVDQATPSSCKYDMFKIGRQHDVEVTTSTTEAPVVHAEPLSVVKDADADFTRTFAWAVAKRVDRSIVKQVGGGAATFGYTVDVTHDAGRISDVTVTGTITVANPNDASVHGVTVTDQLSDGTVCNVEGGAAVTLQPASQGLNTTFTYTCSLAAPADALSNTVTVTWPGQTLADHSVLAAGSADFTFAGIAFTEHRVDDCATVSDVVWTTTATTCSSDASPSSFTYARTVAVPTWACVGYGNIASITGSDSGTSASASQPVTTCGPARTGGLTIGFWQNKNGQAVITGGASTAGVCNSATWLRMLPPFQDLAATSTCSKVAGYATTVIKAANASGSSMNAMLKAQMLATGLDVFFSDEALGGNRIGAPAPIGPVSIDLVKVCKNIAACTIYETTSAAFGGAPSATVSQLLALAAAQANAGGSAWYANVKTVQELAKDTFDAVNNQVAFAS